MNHTRYDSTPYKTLASVMLYEAFAALALRLDFSPGTAVPLGLDILHDDLFTDGHHNHAA